MKCVQCGAYYYTKNVMNWYCSPPCRKKAAANRSKKSPKSK